MLSTIFIYEWKQLIRSKGLIAALLLFTVVGIFCLHQGRSVYQFQQTSIDSAMVKKLRNYEKVKQIFDTLTYANAERNSIEEPFVIEWRLQDAVAKKISPLTVLSIGQSDIYPPLLSGHFNRTVFNNQYAEFQNPEKLLAGNLDVSFFILFLFPLLFIALSYNLQSEDKEAGITPLLAAQTHAVNKLLYQRLFFRWLIALLPLLTIAAVSFILLSGLKNFTTAAWLQWWAVAVLYTLFWLVLICCIQRFHFSSVINAITLAGIWVLLLIAIPGLLNTWFNYKHPSANKTEITEYRDYDFKAWDKPFDQHKEFLFERYPQLKTKDYSVDADSTNLRSFSYSLMVYEKEKQLYEQVSQQKKKQVAAEEKTFWINPVGGVMRSFAAISNCTIHQQLQFEQSVFAYRLQKLKHMYENQLMQPHFTKQDFAALPEYEPPVNTRTVLPYLLPLLFLGFISVAGIIFTNKRTA